MWSLTWPASALLALRWQKEWTILGSKVLSCDKKWFFVLARIQCGPRCRPLSSSASARVSRSAWSPATTSTRPGPSRPSRIQKFSQNGFRYLTLHLPPRCGIVSSGDGYLVMEGKEFNKRVRDPHTGEVRTFFSGWYINNRFYCIIV